MPAARSLYPALLALAVLLVPVVWQAPARAGEWSPAYRDGLRRTIELRRQRRMTRDQTPPGRILPWPMPPALIIRQTPEVHDQVNALLRQLRGG